MNTERGDLYVYFNLRMPEIPSERLRDPEVAAFFERVFGPPNETGI